MGNQEPEAIHNAARATHQLMLGPLDEDVNEQVLREIFGADIDHELLDFAAGAGGNPRLLAEFAIGLVEEGLVKEHNGTIQLTGRRLPPRVLEFVKHQLGNLSTNCQQFLKVAAVLGRFFMLEDVSRMLDRSPATLLPPLDDAIASGFVVTVEHRFAFQSDFLLRGVIESIPGPARGALRREAAGHPAGSTRRSQASDRRSWVAERPMWVAEGPAEPPHGVNEEAGEVVSRAHSLIMNGKVAAGIRVAERVLSDPGSSTSARLDAEASAILGYSILGKEEPEKRSERILRERSTGYGDVAALMALTTLSNTRWRVGELTESLSLGSTAVRCGDSVDPVWRLHFQLALAGKLTSIREFDRAESLINEAEAGLAGLSTPVWAAAPATIRSWLYLQARRFGDARREAELATSAVGWDAVSVLRPLAFSVLSTVSLHMGNLPAAEEHLQRMRSDSTGDRAALYSVQYAWTEVCVAAKREGPEAAIELLSGKYGYLPTQRSLYIEDPGAAAFLVRLALDMGDTNLKCRVLETVEGLAEDNPGISVISVSAMHARALANSDPAALVRIITRLPDPIMVAPATEKIAKFCAEKSPGTRQQAASTYPDPPLASSENVGPELNSAHWETLSEMERRIVYLVSTGLTNRQIAKKVYLSAHTVNYHLRKIYRKLGINTRVELARGVAIYSLADQGEAGLGQGRQ
ncbi:helix-turn-helix transcriptional regulator [Actinacidiphila paucisporea]|uniref:DNA-binding response regulator, NarL/FixJ family, contains REC and HTH domains n=1 Tax=Actinacidiphila paucisporea TaxID=310782 RepID=A0A1M7Q7R9_9ACTN|nr:LuxR C-terminal-related transcriptional regulator [Actinacidiphila paucisporea]SHN26633.1 DNA-binding response regulator, NarL/FixJ family, contains REC and HTH domains [Actinacidiphila paucisporea]